MSHVFSFIFARYLDPLREHIATIVFDFSFTCARYFDPLQEYLVSLLQTYVESEHVNEIWPKPWRNWIRMISPVLFRETNRPADIGWYQILCFSADTDICLIVKTTTKSGNIFHKLIPKDHNSQHLSTVALIVDSSLSGWTFNSWAKCHLSRCF